MPAGKTPHDQNAAGRNTRSQKLFLPLLFFIDNRSANSNLALLLCINSV